MNIKQELVLATELKRVEYKTNIDAKAWQAIADTLNARASVPNPTPQPARPKLLSWTVFMGLLTAADVVKLYSYHWVTDLRAALEANNRTITLAIWRGLKTVLTTTSIAAVEAEANKTEIDPTWTATVLQPSIAMTLGLPVLAAEDVQTVAHRHLGV